MARRLIRREPNIRRSAPISRFLRFGIFSVVKKRKWIALAVVVVIIVAALLLWPKGPKDIPVEKVKKTDFTQSISITGAITSERSVSLSFLTSGKLVYLGASKGDFVDAFQTLAVLDQRTVEESFRQALLDYSKQRNTFDQVKEDNLNRTPREALTDKMRRILENNQHDLNKSVNSVELQALARENSVLITPIAGILTRTDVDSSGVNISPTTIWKVTDPDSLSFIMEVDEADISKVRVSDEVEVVLNSYPDKTIKLAVDSIDFISHTTTTGGNAFNVEAKIPLDNSYSLRVGMNGNAQILVAQKWNVLVIPLGSVINDNKVYVKTKKGFEKRKLMLGLQNDTSVEVLGGLSQGEEIAEDPTLVPSR